MENYFDDNGGHEDEINDESATLIQEIINILESVIAHMKDDESARSRLCDAADKADALQSILRNR
ncbi:hypothetical protein [Komagataeibacter swingsii]|uniref:Uncharacterized protein n=1 Tax=Komagataeibacter swingsii TaxID=215220 RepID=A0A850P2T0_9PROT|nr:hypothetical protein [Komagataeibacter swingsii]NVN38258.1 hypothetical protein [Komagataeibacter swingsii]